MKWFCIIIVNTFNDLSKHLKVFKYIMSRQTIDSFSNFSNNNFNANINIYYDLPSYNLPKAEDCYIMPNPYSNVDIMIRLDPIKKKASISVNNQNLSDSELSKIFSIDNINAVKEYLSKGVHFHNENLKHPFNTLESLEKASHKFSEKNKVKLNANQYGLNTVTITPKNGGTTTRFDVKGGSLSERIHGRTLAKLARDSTKTVSSIKPFLKSVGWGNKIGTILEMADNLEKGDYRELSGNMGEVGGERFGLFVGMIAAPVIVGGIIAAGVSLPFIFIIILMAVIIYFAVDGFGKLGKFLAMELYDVLINNWDSISNKSKIAYDKSIEIMADYFIKVDDYFTKYKNISAKNIRKFEEEIDPYGSLIQWGF